MASGILFRLSEDGGLFMLSALSHGRTYASGALSGAIKT